MSTSHLANNMKSDDTTIECESDHTTIENLPEDVLEAAEIAGNDEDVPCSPPPPYDYVLEEKAENYSSVEGEDDEEEDSTSPTPKGPVIVHTSSKEFYKVLAKQFGITCKMSDDCRCYECQSHYFDCSDLGRTQQEKTDGGLGATTPLFINEAMQGSVCTIL